MEEALFHCRERWDPERVHAMAIYCSDGRWGEAFDDFCYSGLRVFRYDRFAAPGGPAWLTNQDVTLHNAAMYQLEFLVEAHQLERIILVQHYGCAFYTTSLNKEPDDCIPAQENDLRKVKDTILERFPHLKVEGFMAMREGNGFSFHPVQL